MHIPTFIEQKRDGQEATAEDLEEFMRGFVQGRVPDYQAAAWAMAVFFRGMTPTETRHLTHAMIRSGRSFTHPPGSPLKVDKHSTGGVGDKVSLVLAPLLACSGVWVPMVAGRGLGLTGGTLDKLESIPGFNVNLSMEAASAQLARLGVFIIGQTDDFCPADRRLYALRDVTGTVQAMPLIVASVMSKKLAENLDRLVLDIKFGSGALTKTRQDAVLLQARLEEVAREMGVRVCAMLTPMEEPLGGTVGNALEVAEAVATLQGQGPPDLMHLVLDLAERASDLPRASLQRWLQDGTAWKKFVAMVEAQGGDVSALEKMEQVHPAPVQFDLPAPDKGRVAKMDAGLIGRMSVQLGAGRSLASDAIDPAVGFSNLKKVGNTVEPGETMLRVHARRESDLQAIMPTLKRCARVA
jgi:pyrimidine-nucleoside phosphorylase